VLHDKPFIKLALDPKVSLQNVPNCHSWANIGYYLKVKCDGGFHY